MLGDYIKGYLDVTGVFEQAVKVTEWFRNHPYALGKFNEEQAGTYGKIYVLVMSVITRRSTHFYASGRLLFVQTALRALVLKREDELIESVGNGLTNQGQNCHEYHQVSNILGFSRSVCH